VLLTSLHHITHRYNHHALECIFYIFWLQRKLRKANIYVICTSEFIKICHVEIKKKISHPSTPLVGAKIKVFTNRRKLTWNLNPVLRDTFNKVGFTICA
jgi:hypothetical protein